MVVNTTPALDTTETNIPKKEDQINYEIYFSERRKLAEYVCKFGRKVYVESLEYTHQERLDLHYSYGTNGKCPIFLYILVGEKSDLNVPNRPPKSPYTVHDRIQCYKKCSTLGKWTYLEPFNFLHYFPALFVTSFVLLFSNTKSVYLIYFGNTLGS